jgi:hypothetical protein
MYRHKKVGDAVVVDTGASSVTINTSDLVETNLIDGNAFCLSVSDKSKVEQNRSFAYGGSKALNHDKTFRLGLALPAIGTKENISISFSGVIHTFTGGEHQTNADIIRITPFIASEGSTWSTDSSQLSLGNIHYLPISDYSFDTCSINTNIILKDCGYGFDIRTKGTFVGFEIANARQTSATLTVIKGSVNCRYNYAPIKTLDLEV